MDGLFGSRAAAMPGFSTGATEVAAGVPVAAVVPVVAGGAVLFDASRLGGTEVADGLPAGDPAVVVGVAAGCSTGA
jgi:hypothetical protein